MLESFFKRLIPKEPKKAFYAVVRCSDCGEEIRIKINHSYDFQREYDPHNPEHYYTIKREISGKDCFKLMYLTLALTRSARLLFFDVKDCEFVKFERE